MTLVKPPSEAPNAFAVATHDLATSGFFQPLSPSIWASLHPAVQAFALSHGSSLNASRIEELLVGFPDKQFIVHIARHGINIADPRYPCAPFDERNSRSCVRYQVKLFDITRKSMEGNRYFVPPADLRSRHIHQVACIFSPDKDKYREIHNLSKPAFLSINDCSRYLSFRWCRMDDVANRIRPNMWGCRFDVADYYRHFYVSPTDWHLLAFRAPLDSPTGPLQEIWDTRMPFGYRPAVEIAHRMSTAIVYAINGMGIFNVFAVLDDFFALSVPQSSPPHEAIYLSIRDVFQQGFNFPLNDKPCKTHSWQRTVEWGGWIWDLENATVQMKPSRAVALLGELAALLFLKRISAQDIMHLSGLLVWASTVVWGGRTFSQSWLDASAKAQLVPPSYTFPISASLRQSVRWWLRFLNMYNGKRLVLGMSQRPLTIATDATGDGSIGIFIDSQRHIGLTGDEVRAYFDDAPARDAHVYLHECFAVVLAARIFKQHLRNCSLRLITDNPTTARLLRFLSHRIPELQVYAEAIFWLAEECNFRFTDVELVPGVQNECADALSRQQYSRFYALLGTVHRPGGVLLA